MSTVPRRVGVEPKGGPPEAAIGLRASSTVVGLYWASLAATAAGFAGTPPIAGKVQLEGIVFIAGSTPGTGLLHALQLAIASEVPGSQADVDGGEQLFSRASTAVGDRSTMFFQGLYSQLFIPVSSVVALNGRRFIGRVTNLHPSAASDFYVGLVMHRVYGGSSSGDPAFLSGEEVIEK